MTKPKEKKGKMVAITDWTLNDRPREKLASQGRRSLTNAELLAILIRAGNHEETAVDLSNRILRTYQHDLTILSKLSTKEFEKFYGVGEAKAATIVAALELGRRRKELTKVEAQRIVSSKDVYDFLQADFVDLTHEELWVLLLDRKHCIIDKLFVSKGGQSETVVDPKIIFKAALDRNAAAIILAHNHPSGNLKASSADISITKKLRDAGMMLDIPVLDHVIITNESFFSLADEQLI